MGCVAVCGGWHCDGSASGASEGAYRLVDERWFDDACDVESGGWCGLLREGCGCCVMSGEEFGGLWLMR